MTKYECFIQQKEVTSHECWVHFQLEMKKDYLTKYVCQKENATRIEGETF